jgi:hypothetical protein
MFFTQPDEIIKERIDKVDLLIKDKAILDFLLEITPQFIVLTCEKDKEKVEYALEKIYLMTQGLIKHIQQNKMEYKDAL